MITPALPEVLTWQGEEYEVPDVTQLGEWVWDSVCETPDGEVVEHDHPDSWLRLLGFV